MNDERYLTRERLIAKIFVRVYNVLTKMMVFGFVLAEMLSILRNQYSIATVLFVGIALILVLNIVITHCVFATSTNCPYCNNEIDRNDNFYPVNYCGYCGEALSVIKKRAPKQIKYKEKYNDKET
jgi:hypothetical protein